MTTRVEKAMGTTTATTTASSEEQTVLVILVALSFSHLVNDTIQSLVPSVYPILKTSFRLDFGQIGLITLAFQLTASLLQPLVGALTDRRPSPYSLAVGMAFSLCGLVLLSRASSFHVILGAAALVGVGSSIFHPEASRIARAASGGRHGFAQSLFQVGGYWGAALGPLLAAFVVVPNGQHSIGWFAGIAFVGIVTLSAIGNWYARRVLSRPKTARKVEARPSLSRGKIAVTIAILLALIFSKFFYMASLSSYFTFYLMQKFGVGVQTAQLFLFAFLMATAVGTFFGGPIGDRIGRRAVIWGSIVGALPLTLIMPHVGLAMTGVLAVLIGLVLSSAFPAIIVFAQELLPGRIGMVTGLFFGFAFGMGGLGAALLGQLADATSITFVYGLTAFLPAIGLLAWFLPRLEKA
ncbi:fosmidomycin efflux system, member of the major facilitator superfamily [Beijerinckiaceae bacterium RH AL1]|nr:fosmidomycin efflux system, member of the major facilitator superfamily [Beijerinckiaceae bacterium RH CH11]VVB49400.1 fosmidomycin efflux system, member of the major facilitator superfamily [Beijerinckiaceae bacterium RH AL8]VVC56841.1 fosmidomycin efflux system, member of the major facilitator superfamily [Beijerinckiaceae bacterium RH AL1]